MPLDPEFVSQQIGSLLEEAEPRITHDAVYGSFYEANGDETSALKTRVVAAIERLAPSGSPYRQEAEEIRKRTEDDSQKVVWLLGVLAALRDDYADGLTESFTEIVHADLFADFLEMAAELQEKGFKDPAAVLAGSVLEEHLRKLAFKLGVEVEKAPGTPKKADTLNAEIVRAGGYNRLTQKSITAWLDLRNKAAHGRYDEYDERQVGNVIRDVRDFLIRYPA